MGQHNWWKQNCETVDISRCFIFHQFIKSCTICQLFQQEAVQLSTVVSFRIWTLINLNYFLFFLSSFLFASELTFSQTLSHHGMVRGVSIDWPFPSSSRMFFMQHAALSRQNAEGKSLFNPGFGRSKFHQGLLIGMQTWEEQHSLQRRYQPP